MLNDPRRWLDADLKFSRASSPRGDIVILRDDLLEGGTKLRIIPFAVGTAREVVFGGPFCGGAPHALSVWGREAGRKVTLFYAERAELHARQRAARANGATLHFVSPGYMTVVQKRARDYAEQAGALFLPLGLDVEPARDALIEVARAVRLHLGGVDEVWCATGSGMLAQVLAAAFPDAEVCATAVGLSSRHDAQSFAPNVRLVEAGVPFARNISVAAPFPICGHYEAKAWRRCVAEAQGRVLFWNVAAPSPPERPG